MNSIIKQTIPAKMIKKTGEYAFSGVRSYAEGSAPNTTSNIKAAKDVMSTMSGKLKDDVIPRIKGLKTQQIIKNIENWYLGEMDDSDGSSSLVFDSKVSDDIDENTSAEISEAKANTKDITKTIKETSYHNMQASLASTGNLLGALDKQTAVISAGFDTLNENLVKLMNSMNAAGGGSGGLGGSSDSDDKEDLLDGKFNIKTYAKHVADNIDNQTMGAFGMIKAMIPMLTQSPEELINMAVSGAINKIVPDLQSTIKKYDTMLNDQMTGFAVNFGIGDKDDSNFKSIMRKIFGIDGSRSNLYGSREGLTHKEIGYNSIANESIINVIPGYLAKILKAINGHPDDEEIKYDMRNRKFTTDSEMRREFDKRATATGSLNDSSEKFREELQEVLNGDLLYDIMLNNISKGDSKDINALKNAIIGNDHNYMADIFQKNNTKFDDDMKESMNKFMTTLHVMTDDGPAGTMTTFNQIMKDMAMFNKRSVQQFKELDESSIKMGMNNSHIKDDESYRFRNMMNYYQGISEEEKTLKSLKKQLSDYDNKLSKTDFKGKMSSERQDLTNAIKEAQEKVNDLDTRRRSDKVEDLLKGGKSSIVSSLGNGIRSGGSTYADTALYAIFQRLNSGIKTYKGTGKYNKSITLAKPDGGTSSNINSITDSSDDAEAAPSSSDDSSPRSGSRDDQIQQQRESNQAEANEAIVNNANQTTSSIKDTFSQLEDSIRDLSPDGIKKATSEIASVATSKISEKLSKGIDSIDKSFGNISGSINHFMTGADYEYDRVNEDGSVERIKVEKNELGGITGASKGIFKDIVGDGIDAVKSWTNGIPEMFDYGEGQVKSTPIQKVIGGGIGAYAGMGILGGPVGLVAGALAGVAIQSSGLGAKIHKSIFGSTNEETGERKEGVLTSLVRSATLPIQYQLKKTGQKISDVIKYDVLGPISDIGYALKYRMMESTKSVFKNIKSGLKKSFGKVFGKLWDSLKGVGSKIASIIPQQVKDIFSNGAKGLLRGFLGIVPGIVGGLSRGLIGGAGYLSNGLLSGVANGMMTGQYSTDENGKAIRDENGHRITGNSILSERRESRRADRKNSKDNQFGFQYYKEQDEKWAKGISTITASTAKVETSLGNIEDHTRNLVEMGSGTTVLHSLSTHDNGVHDLLKDIHGTLNGQTDNFSDESKRGTSKHNGLNNEVTPGGYGSSNISKISKNDDARVVQEFTAAALPAAIQNGVSDPEMNIALDMIDNSLSDNPSKDALSTQLTKLLNDNNSSQGMSSSGSGGLFLDNLFSDMFDTGSGISSILMSMLPGIMMTMGIFNSDFRKTIFDGASNLFKDIKDFATTDFNLFDPSTWLFDPTNSISRFFGFENSQGALGLVNPFVTLNHTTTDAAGNSITNTAATGAKEAVFRTAAQDVINRAHLSNSYASQAKYLDEKSIPKAQSALNDMGSTSYTTSMENKRMMYEEYSSKYNNASKGIDTTKAEIAKVDAELKTATTKFNKSVTNNGIGSDEYINNKAIVDDLNAKKASLENNLKQYQTDYDSAATMKNNYADLELDPNKMSTFERTAYNKQVANDAYENAKKMGVDGDTLDGYRISSQVADEDFLKYKTDVAKQQSNINKMQTKSTTYKERSNAYADNITGGKATNLATSTIKRGTRALGSGAINGIGTTMIVNGVARKLGVDDDTADVLGRGAGATVTVAQTVRNFKTGGTTPIDRFVAWALESLQSLCSKVLSKFPKASGVVDSLSSFIKNLDKTVFNAVEGQIQKIITKLGFDISAASFSFGLIPIAGAIAGAIGGSMGAANLFGVPATSVDTKMKTIASTLGAIFDGTPAGIVEIIDLVFPLFMNGLGIRQWIARMIYAADSDNAEKLAEAQESMNTQREQYNAAYGTDLDETEFNDAVNSNTGLWTTLWSGKQKYDDNGNILVNEDGSFAKTKGISTLFSKQQETTAISDLQTSSVVQTNYYSGTQSYDNYVYDDSGQYVYDRYNEKLTQDNLGVEIASTVQDIDTLLIKPVISIRDAFTEYNNEPYVTYSDGTYYTDNSGNRIRKDDVGVLYTKMLSDISIMNVNTASISNIGGPTVSTKDLIRKNIGGPTVPNEDLFSQHASTMSGSIGQELINESIQNQTPAKTVGGAIYDIVDERESNPAYTEFEDRVRSIAHGQRTALYNINGNAANIPAGADLLKYIPTEDDINVTSYINRMSSDEVSNVLNAINDHNSTYNDTISDDNFENFTNTPFANSQGKITSGYGMRNAYSEDGEVTGQEMHHGIDIVPADTDENGNMNETSVVATHDIKRILSARNDEGDGSDGAGAYVVYEDYNGNVISNMHLNAGSLPSDILDNSVLYGKPTTVAENNISSVMDIYHSTPAKQLNAGTKLGTIGGSANPTGNSTGHHLHYQVEKFNTFPIDSIMTIGEREQYYSDMETLNMQTPGAVVNNIDELDSGMYGQSNTYIPDSIFKNLTAGYGTNVDPMMALNYLNNPDFANAEVKSSEDIDTLISNILLSQTEHPEDILEALSVVSNSSISRDIASTVASFTANSTYGVDSQNPLNIIDMIMQYGNKMLYTMSGGFIGSDSDIVISDGKAYLASSGTSAVSRNSSYNSTYSIGNNIVDISIFDKITKEVMDCTSSNSSVPNIGSQEATLYDIATGKSLQIQWGGKPGGSHTDFSPITHSDTATLIDILTMTTNATRDSDWTTVRSPKSYSEEFPWSWAGRPGIVQLGAGSTNPTFIAIGFHIRPHASNMVSTESNGLSDESNSFPSSGIWPIGGHMCMWYGSSAPNNGNSDSTYARAMNQAARDAVSASKVIYEINQAGGSERYKEMMSGSEIVYDGGDIPDFMWDYLMAETGNPYVTAGLMGNAFQESSYISKNLQESANIHKNITDDQYTNLLNKNGTDAVYKDIYLGVDENGKPIFGDPGYGLFQWTDTRQDNLVSTLLGNGMSVDDPKGQLAFALGEANAGGDGWSNRYYTPKYETFQSMVDNCEDEQAASYEWLKMFERAGTEKAEKRKTYATTVLNQYKDRVPSSYNNSQLLDLDVDIDESVNNTKVDPGCGDVHEYDGYTYTNIEDSLSRIYADKNNNDNATIPKSSSDIINMETPDVISMTEQIKNIGGPTKSTAAIINDSRRRSSNNKNIGAPTKSTASIINDSRRDNRNIGGAYSSNNSTNHTTLNNSQTKPLLNNLQIPSSNTSNEINLINSGSMNNKLFESMMMLMNVMIEELKKISTNTFDASAFLEILANKGETDDGIASTFNELSKRFSNRKPSANRVQSSGISNIMGYVKP